MAALSFVFLKRVRLVLFLVLYSCTLAAFILLPASFVTVTAAQVIIWAFFLLSHVIYYEIAYQVDDRDSPYVRTFLPAAIVRTAQLSEIRKELDYVRPLLSRDCRVFLFIFALFILAALLAKLWGYRSELQNSLGNPALSYLLAEQSAPYFDMSLSLFGISFPCLLLFSAFSARLYGLSCKSSRALWGVLTAGFFVCLLCALPDLRGLYAPDDLPADLYVYGLFYDVTIFEVMAMDDGKPLILERLAKQGFPALFLQYFLGALLFLKLAMRLHSSNIDKWQVISGLLLLLLLAALDIFVLLGQKPWALWVSSWVLIAGLVGATTPRRTRVFRTRLI